MLRVAHGVLNGLMYMHEKHKLVHTDLIPDNFLIVNGSTKLIGFEGARESSSMHKNAISTYYYDIQGMNKILVNH